MCVKYIKTKNYPREIVEEMVRLYEQQSVEDTEIDGYKVKTNSERYKNFSKNGYVCKHCGIEGTYATLERGITMKNEERMHFNIYGLDEYGNEIMLTKDHRYPKCRGGLDDINNYQVLCEKCNTAKLDNTELSLKEALELGLTTEKRIFKMKKQENTMKKYNELKKTYNNLLKAHCKLKEKLDGIKTTILD